MVPELLASSVVILLFSVIIHEVAHGWMALRFGDRTAADAGRLTLNPIPHIDLVGTILLPGLLLLSNSPILFSWAKPVPVNPLHFQNIRKAELLVSGAGIFANLLLAVIAAMIIHLSNAFFPNILLYELLDFTVNINLLLAVFNILPIPPLDGSKILLSQLSYSLSKTYEQLGKYGLFILVTLMIIPAGQHSVLGLLLNTSTRILRTLLGL